MAEPYLDLLVDNDAALLTEQMHEDIRFQFEEWDPAKGGLATWVTETFGRIHSTTRGQFATVGKQHFKKFGETIVSVPPVLAAPATASSTWTLIDDEGHTIEARTLVTIAIDGDRVRTFEVTDDIVVAPGDTATEAGEVLLQDTEAGSEGNDLTADPQPYSAVAFVESVELVGETSGGVDAEDEDAYVNKLVEAMQLRSESLVLPRDFEIDARAAGAARALCIPGYDGDEEEEAPLHFTVIPVDDDGDAFSAPAKEALLERQAEKTISGAVNHVADPTYTAIDVTTQVTAQAGNDPATVQAAVETRLEAFLSKALWGTPSVGDPGSTGWANATTVYRNELIAEVDRVAGVGRVVTLELAEDGKALGTADVALDGPAPLTEPAGIVVTVA